MSDFVLLTDWDDASVDDAVAIQPGWTELAVTPLRATSWASERIIPSIAALAVE